MGRFCEVFNCFSNNARNISKSFYKFPSNIETCWRWVTFCRSPELCKLFQESGITVLRRKIICSDHFSDESLRDPLRRDRGLRIGAIPSIPAVTSEPNCQCHSHVDQRLDQGVAEHYCNIEYLDLDENEEGVEPVEPSSPENVELLEADFIELMAPSDDFNKAGHIESDGVMLTEPFFKLCQIADSREISDISGIGTIPDNRKDGQTDGIPNDMESLRITSLRAMLKVEREKNSSYKAEIRHFKEQLRTCQKKCNRRNRIIQSQRIKIKSLNDQLKQVRNKAGLDKTVLARLKKNPAIYNSLKNSTRKPKGRRYNPELRKFALSSYLCGPRVYRMMQKSKVMCLPVKRTIKRWTKEIQIGPGLNNAILRQVKSKVSAFSGKERVVILAIDGMKVKSGLSYMAKSDEFHGFPDDGFDRKIEQNNPKYLATEAVTVMVRGVFTKFKQGLGYFLTHNSLGSDQQMKIIEKTIRAIREVGLDPLILLMDQFATNQKMVKEAGVTIDKPYFSVDGSKVYVMWDSPHLIKNARNMLKKHNAVFENEIASFEDITKLYEVDSSANPRLAPRLTEKHIKLPPFSPMNVSLATRTLSQSVASALMYYSNSGELEERVRESVNFITTHDLLFDTFNSRQENCTKKPFKSALKEQSCHWEFLEKAKVSLEKLFFTSKLCFDISKAADESKALTAKQRYPNYVRGFLNNITALKMVWKELVIRFDCEYLCTNNIIQDCLENLFSEVRRRCGSNDTPDCLQFGAAFKYACIEAGGRPTEGTNCEEDDSVPLLSTTEPDTEITLKNSDREKVCHEYKFTPLDVSTPMEIPVKELNALMYVSGAATRKLYHQKCIKSLKAEQNDNLLDDDAYNFCKIKQSVHGRSFILPSSTLYRIGVLCLAAFKQKFKRYLYQNHRNVKTRLKKHISHRLFEADVCQRCFNLLVDKIFNTLIQGFLKQLKSSPTNSKNKMFKRKGKARRMCLPLNNKPE